MSSSGEKFFDYLRIKYCRNVFECDSEIVNNFANSAIRIRNLVTKKFDAINLPISYYNCCQSQFNEVCFFPFHLSLFADHMSSLCKNHFLQQLYRKIDGAVLWSQNERNLDCVVTFQTHSILQRFMLRFDMLQLDCNDHLYIYDGSHAVGAHKVSQFIFIFYLLNFFQICKQSGNRAHVSSCKLNEVFCKHRYTKIK